MKSNKKIDLLLLICFPLVIFVTVFFFNFQINYLESLLLFFGIPSLYLSLKNKDKIKKILSFSLLVSIPIAILVELVGFWDNAWQVPQTVFPFRFFGFSPVENYIWQFLTVYMIVIFYEHFCNKKFQPEISGRIRVMNVVLYALASISVALFVIQSPLLHISYPYLWFCIPFFVVPIVLFLAEHPSFFMPFLKAQIFFFYIHLIFELIGVKLHHWIYPSAHYIGWTAIFGQRFPIEEFVFVMILGAFAALTYYEFFTNKELA